MEEVSTTGRRPGGNALIVVDVAGAVMGGAAKLASELRAYLLRSQRTDVRLIGQDRQLTPTWLPRREVLAAGGSRMVALNNVSFVGPGGSRRVVLRNALHFLDEDERRELATRLPASLPLESAVVRQCARRADVVAVPCTAMAERVLSVLPDLADRLHMRHHPVSQLATRADPRPSILCPVLPEPYKNLGQWIEELARAMDVHGTVKARITVTASGEDLPPSLRNNARIVMPKAYPPEFGAEHWT